MTPVFILEAIAMAMVCGLVVLAIRKGNGMLSTMASRALVLVFFSGAAVALLFLGLVVDPTPGPSVVIRVAEATPPVLLVSRSVFWISISCVGVGLWRRMTLGGHS